MNCTDVAAASGDGIAVDVAGAADYVPLEELDIQHIDHLAAIGSLDADYYCDSFRLAPPNGFFDLMALCRCVLVLPATEKYKEMTGHL